MDSPCFPTHILSEIFSRASLDTVGKSRVVSRACNSATYDSNFSENYTERTNAVHGFFVQSFILGRYSSSFVAPNESGTGSINVRFLLGVEIQIVAAAKQGLLLCENMNPKRHYIPEYYVCKPTTRQWQHIPNPRTRFFTEAMGMVVLGSNPLRYKIVRFSKPKDSVKTYKSVSYSTLHCEVFDSAAWKWKKFEDDVRFPYCECFVGRNIPVVSVGCVLYWLMFNRQVFAFDAHEEDWRIFDLPFPLCSKGYCYYRPRLVEYCGRLGLICQGEDFFELWVMEDREGNVWSKRERVRGVGTPLAFFGKNIVLTRTNCNLIFCNLMNGNAKEFGLRCKTPGDAGVFPFLSDFDELKDKNRCLWGMLLLFFFCVFFTLFLLFGPQLFEFLNDSMSQLA